MLDTTSCGTTHQCDGCTSSLPIEAVAVSTRVQIGETHAAASVPCSWCGRVNVERLDLSLVPDRTALALLRDGGAEAVDGLVSPPLTGADVYRFVTELGVAFLTGHIVGVAQSEIDAWAWS